MSAICVVESGVAVRLGSLAGDNTVDTPCTTHNLRLLGEKSGGGGDPASPPAQIASPCRSRPALDVMCCWHRGVTFKGVNEISR